MKRAAASARHRGLGLGVAIAPLLAVLLAFGSGCAKMERDDRPAPPAPTGSCACPQQVVDPELLAFLSKARAAHHQADLLEDAHDKPGAIRALDRLVKERRPGGAITPPEVAEVTADTRARLADLRSSLGQFDAALQDVTEGLTLARAPTHFRGHLYEIEGLVHERKMKAANEAGNHAAAEKERQLAMDAYEKAVSVQSDVINRALPEPPPR